MTFSSSVVNIIHDDSVTLVKGESVTRTKNQVSFEKPGFSVAEK
jgi:hypothetical protein